MTDRVASEGRHIADGTKDRPRKMTLKELVTFRRNDDQRDCHGHSEIGRTELGENKEDQKMQENQGV